jgi:hypothetical protein
MEEEISSILNTCYIDEELVEQYIDDKMIVFCTHWKAVDFYNDLILHKKIPTYKLMFFNWRQM